MCPSSWKLYLNDFPFFLFLSSSSRTRDRAVYTNIILILGSDCVTWSLSCLESVQQDLKIISISGEHGPYEEPAWILGGGGTSRNTWLCNFPRPGVLRNCLMSFVNVWTKMCPSKLVVLNSLYNRNGVHACFSVYKTKIKNNRTPEGPNYGRTH